jgi:hypothetical protein
MNNQISVSLDLAVGIMVAAAIFAFVLVIFAIARNFAGGFADNVISAYTATYTRDLEEIADRTEPVPAALIYTALRKAGSLIHEFKLNNAVSNYSALEPYFAQKAYISVKRDKATDYYYAEAVIA